MIHRLPLLLLAIALVRVAALSSSDVPYNLKLHDSYIDPQLASDLSQGIGAEPLASYEKHTIKRPDGNGTDEYLCRLPHVEEKKEEPPVIDRESDSKVLSKAVSLIQSSFNRDSCVWAYDLMGSYWTYAFCNGDKVIQYHEAAPPQERPHKHLAQQPNSIFVLGRFSKASTKEVHFKNQASESQYASHLKEAERSSTLVDQKAFPFAHTSEQKVVSQIISDGSQCDMTGQPRTIELIYECAAKGPKHPAIVDVQEIKLCHYKMFLHVPNLCSYEPFVPNKKKADSVVDTVCQKIDVNGERAGSYKNFDQSQNLHLRRHHPNFPIRADNRVNIADLHMSPLNRGFYMAAFKNQPATDDLYVKHRNIVLYNGFYDTLEDLNSKFAHAFYRAIGETLLAPALVNQQPVVLDWSHSFITWFEIYDHLGNLLGISRIEHKSSKDKGVLYAQLLHPETLLDSAGDSFDLPSFKRPDFQAPLNMWNYEYFSKEGKPREKAVPKETFARKPSVAEIRTLEISNKGLYENGTVAMEVTQGPSNSVINGFINEANQFEFEVTVSEGVRKTYAIELMKENQASVIYTLNGDELTQTKVVEKIVEGDDEIQEPIEIDTNQVLAHEIDETDHEESELVSEEIQAGHIEDEL